MAIDFPSSPAAGQVFNASPGLSFVYRNGLWTKAPLTTALPKNYIVNPSMQVSEENGNTASSVQLYYVADQWYHATAGPTGVYTSQLVQVVTPNGSVNRYRETITTADSAAATHLYLAQWLEGVRVADFQYGTVQAKQVVLRFGWKSPAGTYSIRLLNNAGNRSYIANFTVSAGQANTDTVQTLVIPGDTTGTWLTDTSPGVHLSFIIAAASTEIGVAGWQTGNLLGTASNTKGTATASAVFELFDVGLYADPYATGVAPPYVIPDIGVETRRCQRYWYKAFGLHGVVTSGTTSGRSGARHPTPMRITPAGSIKGAPRFYDGAVTTAVSSLVTVCNPYAAEFDVTTGGTFATAGKEAMMYFQTVNDYIAMSARM